MRYYTKDEISLETVAKVAYVWGALEVQGCVRSDLDVDDIIEICKEVACDWANNVDVRTRDEEGYVVAYADRVLQERYGKR